MYLGGELGEGVGALADEGRTARSKRAVKDGTARAFETDFRKTPGQRLTGLPGLFQNLTFVIYFKDLAAHPDG
jgi:hypothetical protein